MTGWWIGILVSGLILRFGKKVQILVWGFAALFAPLSAIYYPVSVLPQWAQKITMFVPTSYVFEGAREVLAMGSLDLTKIYIGFLLNIIFLFIALIFLQRSFNKALRDGLAKLH